MTTLIARLEAAEALFAQGRVGAALPAFEDLISRAQDRSDRPMEAIARAMAARCLLQRHDLDGARQQLRAAHGLVDPLHVQAVARIRAAQARVDLEEGEHQSLRDYLSWADDQRHAPSLVDACTLLADQAQGEDRATWLERAVQESELAGLPTQLGRLCTDLGATLDELERHEEALMAYEQARRYHKLHGTPRQIVGACWAVGAAALATEDYPLAQARLEEAVTQAGEAPDARDLLALTLADLARVHEAAGDVVEARRLVLRAAALAREQDLPGLWPARWRTLQAYARELDLDV